MKRIFIALLFLPTLSMAQYHFVRMDSCVAKLTTVGDIDTMVLRFPKSLTAKAAFDTSKANRTVFIPAQDFVAAQGGFTLWLKRSNISGTADSFAVYYKPLSPEGYPSRNDSTYIIGSASTYGNIVNQYNYTISINEALGLAIIIKQGDTGTQKTTVTAKVVYSQ